MRFMSEEDAIRALALFDGAMETGKITKKALKTWVVCALCLPDVFKFCRFNCPIFCSSLQANLLLKQFLPSETNFSFTENFVSSLLDHQSTGVYVTEF